MTETPKRTESSLATAEADFRRTVERGDHWLRQSKNTLDALEARTGAKLIQKEDSHAACQSHSHLRALESDG